MPKLAILCVDDEVVILNSLIRQLQKEFDDTYTYETSETAEEALEILEELQEENTDVLVIVSDWLMPGKKGDEFLIEVHKKFPKVIKIMLTGQADEEAIQRAIKDANLHRFIAKPWDEKDLIDSIKSGLEQMESTVDS
jgi:response regulator RpfG family c-di-GMP phosphodiesterase